MKISKFKLERYLSKYEFKAPYPLGLSDCESLTIKELLNLEPGASAQFKKVRLGYTKSEGSPDLRDEISKLYSTINSENVIVATGGGEVIFILMNILLDKGDNIIVQFPAYQSLFEIARSIGCSITKWVMDENKGWDLDIGFLEENIQKNTKAVIINFPHNPTGQLMTRKKMKQLCEIASDHGVYVISDEVYKGLEYVKSDRLKPACDVCEKGISIGSMSKTYGLPGVRIGWVATKDNNVLKEFASFKDYTSISNSAASEFLSTIALKHRNSVANRNLGVIKHNLKLLDKFFEKHKSILEWVRPKAGPIAFPKLKLDVNSETFCIDLVNKMGALLLPSTHYDFGDKHFRIGFGKKNMPTALAKFEEYLEQF